MPTSHSQKLFNAAFHALPADDQTAAAQQLRAGQLTLREAVAKCHADVASVDEWVEFWHEGGAPGELRDFLGIDTTQYSLWMREPESLAASLAAPVHVFSVTEYIPMGFWGKDHWSTLAYLESVMVDCAGFQVGTDARMKTGRRNWRVMAEGCASPKRAGRATNALSMVMTEEQSTKLNNGQRVSGHDDWSCVQDMAAEGLFAQAPDAIEPGVILAFSPKGVEIANGLREFKRNKGQSAQFRWPMAALPADAELVAS